MFATQRYPEELSPEELDAYLAHGWYRMGESIFTTHFLCFEAEFYSALWVRLPLHNYRFNKRLSKLLRSNQEQYGCIIQPASIDAEKEQLYQKYREDFPAPLPPTLAHTLLDDLEPKVFQTYELLVYDQDQLIGLSYFDLGAESAASILGIYHPAYKKQSIGFFTMLMEIAYCQEHGFQYYYPGYVAPGYPRFDYKLRIGAVEYFDLQTAQWLSYNTINLEDIPIKKMVRQLTVLSDWMQLKSIPHHFYYYPLFETNLTNYWPKDCFDFPVMLRCAIPTPPNQHIILVFDPVSQKYLVLLCRNASQGAFQFNTIDFPWLQNPSFFNGLILSEQLLHKTSSPEALCAYLEHSIPVL